MTPAELTSAYEALVELTERELACAQGRQLTELVELTAARDALVERLPPSAPAAAAGALRRCMELRAQIDKELSRTREELINALAAVQRGARAARGYAPPSRAHGLIQADA